MTLFEDFELVFDGFDYGSITFRVILVPPSWILVEGAVLSKGLAVGFG
mgnify:CR=1 FL=1